MTKPKKKWVIDPAKQTFTERTEERLDDLIDEVLGNEYDCLPLDSNTDLYCSDTPTNPRYAYYFCRTVEPFSMRRYNRGLIVSRGPWDETTCKEWVRFYDKKNIWGDL